MGRYDRRGHSDAATEPSRMCLTRVVVPGPFLNAAVVNRPTVWSLRNSESPYQEGSARLDVELEKIARNARFSGADLGEPGKLRALWAARSNKKEVEFIDFEMAKQLVLMLCRTEEHGAHR